MPGMDEGERDRLTSMYASFVQHAWNGERGRFRNFMHFDRTWAAEEGSEDSFGRAVWAVGVTARHASAAKHRDWASTLFDRIAGEASGLVAPRARDFAMLGAAAIQAAPPGQGQSKRIQERSEERQ